MALTSERVGQIAMIAFQSRKEEEGVRLNPKQIRRDISNEARKLGIPVHEAAQFVQLMFREAYDKTMAELDELIPIKDRT